MELEEQKPVSNIKFYTDKNETQKWAIEINSDGIFFNRDLFPTSEPKDFAQFFIDILEKNYDVKFEKKIEGLHVTD